VVASQLQAVMVSPWSPDRKVPGDYSAVLIGPGLADKDIPDQFKTAMRHVWRFAPVPVVMDASGLDWLPLEQNPATAVRVITPHPGEAARLLRASAQQVLANRVEAVRNLSRRHGNAWVVLKGHQTMIGRSTGDIHFNSSGNPHLAQGGSGDVLAGYIAGLLAQQQLRVDVGKTLRYAVWQHGATADKLQQANWVVEDLVEELGNSASARERMSGTT